MIKCIHNTKEVKEIRTQKGRESMFDYVTAMHNQNSHDSSEESKTGLSNQKKEKEKREEL